MKFIVQLAVFLSSISIHAASDVYSLDRLTKYYEKILCEEKRDLFNAGVGSKCNRFNLPPKPPAPPFRSGQLPVVLVNDSGLPDSEIYVVVTGDQLGGSTQVFVSVDVSTGQGTIHPAMVGENALSYSYPLSQLPMGSSGRVIYMPEIKSGLIWFSVGSPLNMPVIAGPAIQQPNFTNPSDPNYYTNFDIFELAFNKAGSPAIGTDATAVSFFSIPLHGYLAGATSTSDVTGLYQPRSHILSSVQTLFDSVIAPEKAQWNNLFLRNGGNILRLLSTAKAMSAASLFDSNYLDNQAAYGYSYLSDIWTGVGSFYKTNQLKMQVTVTVPFTATYDYTGQVNGMNEFVFTSSNGGPSVTLPAPQTAPLPVGTTSYNIFGAVNFITPLPVAGTAADAVSKLLQEAIIASLIPIPVADQLSLSYLNPPYYTVNPRLSAVGQMTGPWYDLYSKGLHDLGSIYTYGFDEPLWPHVLLSGPFVENSTYMSITIGNLDP